MHCAKRILTSKSFYVLIATLATLIGLLKIMQPQFSNFTLTTPSGLSSATSFPFFTESNESGVYRVAGTITMGKYTSSIMRIIPDDEILGLSINQQNVDLSNIPLSARRDYSMGFVYDLGNYLKPGENAIEIIYSDGGGLMGINMSAEGSQSQYRLCYLLLSIALLALCVLFLKPAKIRTAIKVLFVGALLIRLAYFMVTPADVRDHDLGDHIGYTEYLSQHWFPPPLEYAVGGAFFHPPLYYYTGALVYKATLLVEPFNKVSIYRVQQFLSLCYSMGFVFFGLLILNELISRYNLRDALDTQEEQEKIASAAVATGKPWLSLSYWCESYTRDGLFWVIGALFAFYPVAIIHSVRIGNDPMLYCLFTASLYYVVRWYRMDHTRDLLIASVIGAAAIITKANGEILVAVIAIVGLYKMIKTRAWLNYIKMALVPCAIMLTAVAITVGPGLILKMEGKRDKLYIDNIDGLSQANLVGNTAANYFWFDAKTFITEPFTDPYDDRMGRQYFWNYLGKTGLFGEFKYNNLTCINSAVFSSFLAVIMFIYLLAGLYFMRKRDFSLQAVLLLSGFFLWAGITYMRMTFPANIDFRYIVPILLTFCGLYAVSIHNFRHMGAIRLANIGISMALLFSLSSIIFITGIVMND